MNDLRRAATDASARAAEARPRPEELPPRSLEAARPLREPASALRSAARQHGRRKLADLLHAARLDVVYRRGAGAYLFRDVGGDAPAPVLDLLAGYGTGLLGHQPEPLVEVARASLDEGLSMNAQASCRGWSAVLCRRLAQLLERATDRSYLVHLVNTGSEASEAAVRHAALAHAKRATETVRQVEAGVQELREAWPELSAAQREALLREAESHAPLRARISEARARGLGDDALPSALLAQARAVAKRKPVYFAFEESYHGSGCAAARLSHGRRYRRGLEGLGAEVRFVDPMQPHRWEQALPELDDVVAVPVRDRRAGWRLRVRTRSRAAALFLEVIQGEGGVRVVPDESLQRHAQCARAHGVPVVADEIQTGLGRTGEMFAVEASGIRPDMVLLGKVLGGGMAKIAACAIAREHYHDDFSLQHVSTFAEDDASSRIACGVLEMLTEADGALLGRVDALGRTLRRGLEDLQRRWPQVIAEVRGRGLMLGLELAEQSANPSPLLRAFDAEDALGWVCCGWLLHEEQVRLASATRQTRTLRIQPSVCLSAQDAEHALAALDRLCARLADGDVVSLTRYLHGSVRPAPPAEELLHPQHSGERPPAAEPDLDRGTSYGVLHRGAVQAEVARVAFLGHPIDVESARGVEPRMRDLDDAALHGMLDRMVGDPGVYPQRRFRVRSRLGSEVDALVLSWQPLPATWMRARRDPALRSRLRDSIHEAMEAAAEEGCRVVGFGAYTSIFTGSCREVRNERVRVTSGNALTAGMADRALEHACRTHGLPLARARVAVVGATGNIGLVHARLLAGRAAAVHLVGPPGSERRLEELRARLCSEEDPVGEISWSTDPASVRTCPVVVSATNATRPLFGANDLAPGRGVFLDVSVPSDLRADAHRRSPEILFLQGGVVRVPHGPRGHSGLELPGWHLPRGHAYACLAETLLLGLEDVDRDYSCGALRVEDVRAILAMADRHGFELGLPQAAHEGGGR